jgi:hypothetical protein
MAVLRDLSGLSVLCYEVQDPLLDSEQRAVDLIGEALAGHASIIAVPVDRLDNRFFQLRSGLAGAIVQKMVNYRLRLAVVGDITEQLAASSALRAWVRECQRGTTVFFVPSLDALTARLSASAPPPTPADGD